MNDKERYARLSRKMRKWIRRFERGANFSGAAALTIAACNAMLVPIAKTLVVAVAGAIFLLLAHLIESKGEEFCNRCAAMIANRIVFEP